MWWCWRWGRWTEVARERGGELMGVGGGAGRCEMMSAHQHLFMMKRTISSCSRYIRLSGRRDAMIIVITVET